MTTTEIIAELTAALHAVERAQQALDPAEAARLRPVVFRLLAVIDTLDARLFLEDHGAYREADWQALRAELEADGLLK